MSKNRWKPEPETQNDLSREVIEAPDQVVNPTEYVSEFEQPEPQTVQHIRLTSNYGGRRTKEQRIEPGVYAANDPRLFGLDKYLVQSGHAVWVEVKG